MLWIGPSPVTATLRDIARQVNRSVTTVSRALHDYEDVSPETRALVKRTALQLGYAPNVVAQRLQKQRADTVGLILPTQGPRLSDPHFGEVLAGVADAISQAGFDLVISVARTPAAELDAYRHEFSGRRVDSVLVVRTQCHDPRIELLLRRQAPFVAYGRVLDEWDFPYVDVDHAQGMRELVRHLSELGHQRVAFITGAPELTFVHYQLEGFRNGMAECGLTVDERFILAADMTQRGGYQAGQIALGQSRPPTAIVASNDLMALGAISAAQDHGLDVGRDLAVAGFDDIPLADTAHPTLTTVRQPAYQLGQRLGQLLVATAAGETPARPQYLLEPALIIRQSTSLDLWL